MNFDLSNFWLGRLSFFGKGGPMENPPEVLGPMLWTVMLQAGMH